ncbi:MAG TPA: ShlB/FhaC/HecB family hemolysin secretion/activation protein [Chlamydiales bacterium]|nr:ShlB/FhaC/HecB family hemolysin secretion/activation protein [Chlamydiales bacterium]
MRFAKWLLVCALCLLSQMDGGEEVGAFLDESGQMAKREVPEVCSVCPLVRGVVLVNSSANLLPKSELEEVCGFYAPCVDVPGSKSQLERRLAPLYVDQPVTQEMIRCLKQEIQAHYQENGRPFVLVAFPKQPLGADVLQFVVMDSHIGQVRVEGNCYTSDCRFLSRFKPQCGDIIDQNGIQRDLDFMNRNQFTHVSAVYSPGQGRMTTDIALLVHDRRPYQFFAGADNTGVETTNRQRLFAGFSGGQPLLWDFTYQYTTSYDPHRFQAHTAQARGYFPWKHLLNVYGGVAFVHTRLSFPGSTNHGTSGQISTRYIIPLPPIEELSHEIQVGFDFKRTNNTIIFSELFSVVGKNVNLSQFVLEYEGYYNQEYYRINYGIRAYWSPGEMMSDQSNSDYNTLRPGAVNHWVYGKLYLRYEQKLRQYGSLNIWARGQISNESLLPSEQIGLGGYDTVRGYDERQFNYDGGFLLSAEFRTPHFDVIRYIRCSHIKDALQFLAFIDSGWGTNHKTIPGEPQPDYLLSTGPGVRYTLDPYFSARLDWGIKLHQQAVFTGGGSMLHFNTTFSY